MINPEYDIYDTEALQLINKLYSFLGPSDVDRALNIYQRYLNKSGPIVSRYTINKLHPWWNAFRTFFELQKKAKSIKRNLTPELKILAADAKKILTLRRFMPSSVVNKYKKDLLDLNRAIDYLFEIHIAWHYYLQKNEILWYEDDGKKHPEFLVKTPYFDFNVECKRITYDLSKKITRQDFHRFTQELFLKIKDINFTGNIDITINGRLLSNQINVLVSEVLELINLNKITEESKISLGQVSLNLIPKNKIKYNISELFKNLQSNLEVQQHIALFSPNKDGNYIIDPIQVSLSSQEKANVLDGIYDKVNEAAKTQLDTSIPGIIVCFLEDVYDLRDLSKESGLQIMTCNLLNKATFSHIAGIGYSSEIQIHKYFGSEVYNNQGLFFKNPNCKFDEVKTFTFMNEK
jgi:hypothetical protein